MKNANDKTLASFLGKELAKEKMKGLGGNDTETGGEGGTTGGNSDGGTGNTGGIPPPIA